MELKYGLMLVETYVFALTVSRLSLFDVEETLNVGLRSIKLLFFPRGAHWLGPVVMYTAE